MSLRGLRCFLGLGFVFGRHPILWANPGIFWICIWLDPIPENFTPVKYLDFVLDRNLFCSNRVSGLMYIHSYIYSIYHIYLLCI